MNRSTIVYQYNFTFKLCLVYMTKFPIIIGLMMNYLDTSSTLLKSKYIKPLYFQQDLLCSFWEIYPIGLQRTIKSLFILLRNMHACQYTQH